MKIQDADGKLFGLSLLSGTIATNGSGDGSVSFSAVRGRILSVQVEAANAALDSGADWTLSGSKSGTIMTKANAATFLARPRTLVQDSAGADIAASMEAPIVFDETLTLTVANGGASKGATTPAPVRIVMMRGLL